MTGQQVEPTRLADLARSGGTPLMATGVLARLPFSTTPMILLLATATTTGSYGTAGAAVAGLGIGGAVAGPLIGVWADRVGPRIPIAAVTLAQMALLVVFALALGSVSDVVLIAIATALGAANPVIGSFGRWAWSQRLEHHPSRRGAISTAMAWETMADETGFVIGPVIGSVLFALLGGPTTLMGLAGLALLASTLFIGALPRPTAAAPELGAGLLAGLRSLPFAVLVPCGIVALLVGSVFGSVQTGVAEQFAESGRTGLAGPVYGALGVGSAIGAALSTRLPVAWSSRRRLLLAGAVLAGAGVAMAAAEGPVLLAAGCAVAGFGVAPSLATVYARMEGAVPRRRLTTAMVALATCTAVGVSLGAAGAGQLIDAGLTGTVLLGASLAGVLIMVTGLALREE
ncbi:MAG: hypothetical protein Q4G40_01605 [Brachybacterium sp.]|nr:hypothetical protein [Brachybacterium sp.]